MTALAATCLTAAERAWTAANTYPSMYAVDNFHGGGPYDDSNVTDEFYWAAAELYITTDDSTYLTYLQGSSHYRQIPTTLGVEGSGSMTWKAVPATGQPMLIQETSNGISGHSMLPLEPIICGGMMLPVLVPMAVITVQL